MPVSHFLIQLRTQRVLTGQIEEEAQESAF